MFVQGLFKGGTNLLGEFLLCQKHLLSSLPMLLFCAAITASLFASEVQCRRRIIRLSRDAICGCNVFLASLAGARRVSQPSRKILHQFKQDIGRLETLENVVEFNLLTLCARATSTMSCSRWSYRDSGTCYATKRRSQASCGHCRG